MAKSDSRALVDTLDGNGSNSQSSQLLIRGCKGLLELDGICTLVFRGGLPLFPSKGMEEMLREAAQGGDIDMLYALIRQDPYLLERLDEIPFVDTPLHAAARTGHARFAMEIMRLKPSFSRKPNPDGFSPLHLALQNGHTQMVLRFLDDDCELVRVKGRDGITPLHYVAEKGNTHLLVEFLSACPKSIEDLTNQRETALHIAVKNNMLEAFEILVGWLRRNTEAPCWERRILNWKDDEGNTVLHIAAYQNQPQVVRLLTDFSSGWWGRLFMDEVYNNVKNLEGLTALDILERQGQVDNREVRDMLCLSGALTASALHNPTTLADHLRSKIPFWEKFATKIVRLQSRLSGDTRNVLLVIAVLIATTSYQTVLSPPGGVWQDDCIPILDTTTTTNVTIATAASPSQGCQRPHFAGTAVLLGAERWDLFVDFSVLAFIFSFVVIFLLLPHSPLSCFLAVSLVSLYFCFCINYALVIKPKGYDFSTLSFLLLVLLELYIVRFWFHGQVQRKVVHRLWKYLTILGRGTAGASSSLP